MLKLRWTATLPHSWYSQGLAGKPQTSATIYTFAIGHLAYIIPEGAHSFSEFRTTLIQKRQANMVEADAD